MSFAGPFVPFDVAVMLRGIGLGHEHVDFLTDNLFRLVAEDSLRRWIEQDDSRLPIDGHHRILGGVDQTAHPGFGAPLLGHVAHDHLDRCAVIPCQRRRDGLGIDRSNRRRRTRRCNTRRVGLARVSSARS